MVSFDWLLIVTKLFYVNHLDVRWKKVDFVKNSRDYEMLLDLFSRPLRNALEVMGGASASNWGSGSADHDLKISEAVKSRGRDFLQ